MEAGRGLGVIAVFAAAAFVWVSLLIPETPPPAPRAFAGIYANPCCGSFTIGSDRMFIDNAEVSIETGFDKKGVFIIPDKYVGVIDGNRVGIFNEFPMKLYVNRRSNPVTIKIWDTAASTTYDFAKTAKAVRVR